MSVMRPTSSSSAFEYSQTPPSAPPPEATVEETGTSEPSAGAVAPLHASGMRPLIKRAALGGAMALVSPVTLATRIGTSLFSEGAFIGFATMMSLIPGAPGSFLRVAYYKGVLASASADWKIGFGSFFSKRAATVGARVHIGAYCVLGWTAIGDDVTIASRVSIPSGRRQHHWPGLERSQDVFSPVRIGARTWIGEGAIVMADVGADCIIGAGAVVVRPIPDGCIAVGNPAVPRLPRTDEASTAPAPTTPA